MYRVQQARPSANAKRKRLFSPLFLVFLAIVTIYSSFLWYWFAYRDAWTEQSDEEINRTEQSDEDISSFPDIPSLELRLVEQNHSTKTELSSQPPILSDARNSRPLTDPVDLHDPTHNGETKDSHPDEDAKGQLAAAAAIRGTARASDSPPANAPAVPEGPDAIVLAAVSSSHPSGSSPEEASSAAGSQAQQVDRAKQPLASNLHIFYYGWYGTPEQDGKWLHWDHQVLPHWTKEINAKFPEIGKKHQPPHDIGSNYYPLLGPYSSSDPKVIRAHLDQIAGAGIGVLVYSWWGRGTGDANGAVTDEKIIDRVMAQCRRTGVKFAFHLEPYEGRTALSVKKDAEYLMGKYGEDEALYRMPTRGGRTVFYVYDSYHISAQDWAAVLKADGKQSVRGGSGDAVFVGLWVEEKHGRELQSGGFDGLYTYFASKGFTYGSTYHNWERMARFADAHRMLFVPSIGPGYIDTAIRPWNAQNKRERMSGTYLKDALHAADRAKPEILSLTSFNEWHEGTQFEPIQKWPGAMDYGSDPGTLYLDIVRQEVERCSSMDRPNWCGDAFKSQHRRH